MFLSRSVSLCVAFISVQHFLSCRQSNTRRWLNAGLMLVNRLRRWANIGPELGYRVMFGAMLNVGQRRRRQANINPASVQIIVPVPPACRYRQHEVLTTAAWILASTCDAGPTFNRHWVSVTLYSPPAVSTSKQVIKPPLHYQTSVLLNAALVLTSHIVFRTSAWFQNGVVNST